MIIENFITKDEVKNVVKMCANLEPHDYVTHYNQVCNDKINFIKDRISDIFGNDMIYGFEHLEHWNKPRFINSDVGRLQKQMFPNIVAYPVIYPPIKKLGYTFSIPLKTYDCKTFVYKQNDTTINDFDEYLKNYKVKPNAKPNQYLLDNSSHVNKKYFYYLELVEIFDWNCGSLHYYDSHHFFSTNNWKGLEDNVSSINFWSYYPE